MIVAMNAQRGRVATTADSLIRCAADMSEQSKRRMEEVQEAFAKEVKELNTNLQARRPINPEP